MYRVISHCTALCSRSVQERNDWLDALNSAIEEYRSRKATFSSLEGGAGLGSPLVRAGPGESAPVWIPDQRVTMCQVTSS